MSSTAKRLVLLAVTAAAAILVACLSITWHSLDSLRAAQAAATTEYDGIPSTQPATLFGPRTPTTGPSVRVAVIGGMSFTGFWNDLATRYEQQRGVHVEMIATGEKNDIARAFLAGGVDVITMHASDTIINLVADGYAMDPQPWMRNDLILVGPPADPAGIKGMTDVATALRKIAAAKAPFVVHSSLGAQEVLLNIMEPNQIMFDPAQTTVLFDDQQRSVLRVAEQKQAYTLIGRIPFRTGRLPNDGLDLMVQGDPRLCRPYIVAVANPASISGVHVAEARQFAAYLREPDTQSWIANYGRGLIDDRPLFFPVTPPEPATRPAGIVLTVGGQVPHPLELTADALAALPHCELKVKGRDAAEARYSGVALEDVLKAAGMPFGNMSAARMDAGLCAIVSGSDGYRAVFSLTELATSGAKRVILADARDGKPLNLREGPVRLIAADDATPARWVRQAVSVTVAEP